MADNQVIRLKAGENLGSDSVVATDFDRNKLRVPVSNDVNGERPRSVAIH